MPRLPLPSARTEGASCSTASDSSYPDMMHYDCISCRVTPTHPPLDTQAALRLSSFSNATTTGTPCTATSTGSCETVTPAEGRGHPGMPPLGSYSLSRSPRHPGRTLAWTLSSDYLGQTVVMPSG